MVNIHFENRISDLEQLTEHSFAFVISKFPRINVLFHKDFSFRVSILTPSPTFCKSRYLKSLMKFQFSVTLVFSTMKDAGGAIINPTLLFSFVECFGIPEFSVSFYTCALDLGNFQPRAHGSLGVGTSANGAVQQKRTP